MGAEREALRARVVGVDIGAGNTARVTLMIAGNDVAMFHARFGNELILTVGVEHDIRCGMQVRTAAGERGEVVGGPLLLNDRLHWQVKTRNVASWVPEGFVEETHDQ